jgi:glyoxylate/hydroxypyruvate/2-ketogluconate reductase
LKVVANMAVGFNNFDLDAMTRHGVQGTNAPDVLTETTADFGLPCSWPPRVGCVKANTT